MRFRLDHPTYPALGFYLLAPNADVEDEVNRLGPLDIISASFDWPPNERPYHGWTDRLNRILWPSHGDNFASCLLLIDDDRAKILSALCAVERAAIQGDIDDVCPGIANSLTIAQAAIDTAITRDEALVLCGSDELAIALVRSGVGADEGYETIDPAVAAAINLAFTQTISAVLAASEVTVSSWAPRPYVLIRAMMSPKEAARAAETYPAAEMTADDVSDTVETELMAWKMYPLPPVRLPETDEDDPFRGFWILPLVDLRYFWRLGPVSSGRDDGYSSNSVGDRPTDSFPVSHVNPREAPDWMPPLRSYPDDTGLPGNYVPILDNGTHPAISPTDSRGWAANIQADMENWRIVCRDVRSNWNSVNSPHTQFTGILSEYPDDPDAEESYHLDAIALAIDGNLIDGGPAEVQQVESLIPRKIRCLFRIANQSRSYEVDVYPTVSDPTSVSDLSTDNDGPNATETPHLPKAVLGQLCPQEDPDDDTLDDIRTAAKQWTILYYLWRRNQYFLKFPGIAPIIPNGHAHAIFWDFSAGKFETTYTAAESTEGTGEAGFGGPGDGAASDDAGNDDNTAFVLCTAETTVDGRYPVIRMDQVGLPETWEDAEAAWGMNVLPQYGMKAGELYLCHKNLDQFLGLNQWATRDCCSQGSVGSEPDNYGCWNGCCASDQDLRTIDVNFLAVSGDCPCPAMTVTIHCDSRHRHWYGHSSCTDGNCTIEIFLLLQCIPCGDLASIGHPDCPVDCTAAPFYFCLHYYIRCSGGCAASSTTGHVSWASTEVNCGASSVPKFVRVCGCEFFTTLWDTDVQFDACLLGLHGTWNAAPGVRLSVPKFLFGHVDWCLFPNSDPLTCHDCYQIPDTDFVFIWDETDQRWESAPWSAAGEGGCTWNSFGITITPVWEGGGGGPVRMDVSSVWSITENVACHNPQGLTTSTGSVKTPENNDRTVFLCPCTRLPLATLPIGMNSGECSFFAYVYC